MRIVLLYNEPLQSRYDELGEGLAIASVMDAVRAIRTALESQGHTVELAGLLPLFSSATLDAVISLRADVVFNLFEGFGGRPDTEWQVAGALEAAGLRFTGASARVLALCLNKAKAKQRLARSGVPTAPFQLLHAGNLDRVSLPFPVIVKPLGEDGSHGLSPKSVVHDLQSLKEQVLGVAANYGSPVLVESFLSGREFNVAVLGGPVFRALPPTEIVYTGDVVGPRILTYAAKWQPEDPMYQATVPVCPALVSEVVNLAIQGLALAAHKALGSAPYARVDIREDSQGRLYVLEVNPNPDLSPDTGIARQAGAAGMEYGEMIKVILGLAIEEKRRDRRRAASHAN